MCIEPLWVFYNRFYGKDVRKLHTWLQLDRCWESQNDDKSEQKSWHENPSTKQSCDKFLVTNTNQAFIGLQPWTLKPIFTVLAGYLIFLKVIVWDPQKTEKSSKDNDLLV